MMSSQRIKSESGAGLIETALIMPLIFMLLTGAYYVHQSLQVNTLLTNVTNEGARFLSRQPNVDGQLYITDRSDLSLEAVVSGNGAGSATHQHILGLMRGMNRAESNFALSDIRIETQLQADDTVQVVVAARVDMIELLPRSLLQNLGWRDPFRIRSTSVQPYLY